MKELTEREQQWLNAFAKNHEFFNSFLLVYKLKYNLSNNQYYWLHLYINQAEEEGDTLLNAEELIFLKENTEKDYNLKEILEIHNKLGYLEKPEYTMFLELKSNLTKQIKRDIESSITHKSSKSPTNHKIIKIPCPHCSFLCSTQIDFCAKCGEPLPKLEAIKKSAGDTEIIDVDYTERNIICSLEKLINKHIPLKETFERNSTCYVKTNDEITGISLFKCGLDYIPSEIFKVSSLKYLALRRNNIMKIPKEIAFLSNLESVDLRLNKLEKLPNAIGLLLKLKVLNLSSNKIKEIPKSIGDLISLKKLNLANNRLKVIPESISNLNKLEILNLKTNYWIHIPGSIEKLKERGFQIIL